MKTANVLLPFTGYVYVVVEDVGENVSDSEVVEMAMEMTGDWTNEEFNQNIGEFSYHEKVTSGFVTHAVLNEAEVEFEEIDE